MKNKTFTPGPNPTLNAVVGKGWAFDKNYAYIAGFEQAIEVLLVAAVNESYIDPEMGEPRSVYIDALVYPICFCARHFIELFLKRQIGRLSTLRGGEFEDASGTHDLAALWIRLRKHIPLDRRLASIADKIEEFVADFAVIDITGETFRYAFDRDNNAHLDAHSLINIEVLGNRLKILRSYAEEFENLVEWLRDEYGQRTFTTKLSRAEIEQIANMLPLYETWESGALKAIKPGIMTQFEIGSNDFKRAIDIIRGHQEFSERIGIEIPLVGMSINLFDTLSQLRNAKNGYQRVEREQWARLAAISEIGHLGMFSESYSGLVTLFLSDQYEGRIDPPSILRELTRRNNSFRRGLCKLGQPTLLAKFDVLFPEPPPESPISPEEQLEKIKETLKTHSLKTRNVKSNPSGSLTDGL